MLKGIGVWGLVFLGVTGVVAVSYVASRKELGKQRDGTFIVPSGQTISPVGNLVLMDFSRPKDVELSPDGKTVAVLATDGVHLFSPEGTETAKIAFPGGPLGLAFDSDGMTMYASQENGRVAMLTKQGSEWKREELLIDLPGKRGNPQATGLAVVGRKLYVALGIRNTLVEYDLDKRAISRSVAVDVAPYHLLSAPAEQAIYLACRGGRLREAGPGSAASAGSWVDVDTRTDAAKLGSVMRIDLASMTATRAGEGRQPAGLSLVAGKPVAALADSDQILRLGRSAVSVRPAEDANFGQIPTSVAMSGDGKSLYVALGGANAIAVCDPETLAVRGYVPTAYYPMDLLVRGDDLIVACAKGIGSRAESKNPGEATSRGIPFQKGLYGIHNNVGAMQFISGKDLRDLGRHTKTVARNNAWGKELPARENIAAKPIPDRVGEPSVFKHVVFIIKENLTYDSILGDMREGNGRADLCMFPEFVSPNHHQLSRDFVLLDNTYVSGTNSADGHQWTASAVANDYMEHNYAAAARSYPYDGGDPLSTSPEGFIWNAALKSNKTVRVFGEFVDKPVVRNKETGKGGTSREIWDDYKKKTGKFEIRAETSQKALEKILNPYFIGFPNSVPDQWRVDRFMDEFRQWEMDGAMPNLTVMLLPDDHTGGFQPDFPTPWAAVADNDLALGRVVEAISKSPFWKDTLILCIEDDGQLGIDHVDGHRTFALAVSPYTKRGTVVSEMYTTVSVLRTIGLVLGLPAMTRFDRTARPMRECFTSTPDFKPYAARPNRVPLDQFTPAPEKLTGTAKQLALASARLDWSEVDRAKADVVARSAWHFAFPNKAFPVEHFHPNFDEDDEEEKD